MFDYKKYEGLCYDIIGAAMEVHRVRKFGLLESVYNECLHIELEERGIDNEPEQELNCYYKSHKLNKKFRMDIVVGDVCVELKSVKDIIPAHRAQLFNYLRLTKKPIGLLINFGNKHLQGERYAYIEETNECVLMDKNMNLLFDEPIDCDYESSNYLDDK